jgi:hypothetical protein
LANNTASHIFDVNAHARTQFDPVWVIIHVLPHVAPSFRVELWMHQRPTTARNGGSPACIRGDENFNFALGVGSVLEAESAPSLSPPLFAPPMVWGLAGGFKATAPRWWSERRPWATPWLLALFTLWVLPLLLLLLLLPMLLLCLVSALALRFSGADAGAVERAAVWREALGGARNALGLSPQVTSRRCTSPKWAVSSSHLETCVPNSAVRAWQGIDSVFMVMVVVEFATVVAAQFQSVVGLWLVWVKGMVPHLKFALEPLALPSTHAQRGFSVTQRVLRQRSKKMKRQGQRCWWWGDNVLIQMLICVCVKQRTPSNSLSSLSTPSTSRTEHVMVSDACWACASFSEAFKLRRASECNDESSNTFSWDGTQRKRFRDETWFW